MKNKKNSISGRDDNTLKPLKTLNFFIFTLIMIFFLIRYHRQLIVFVFGLVIFLIRYFRQKNNIPFTFEPVLLFSVILLKSYGFAVAAAIAFFPNLIADTLNGRFSSFTILFCLLKVVVLIPISLISNNLYIVSLVSYFLISELLGNTVSYFMGGELKYIISGVTTGILIRLLYFQVFFIPLCNLLKMTC
ncbi:MAG: hypothetical protein KKF44_08055 [Nanoarchaeota archaeon]|nr:hypothetical protein [Nanoarchaeota archaeon]